MTALRPLRHLFRLAACAAICAILVAGPACGTPSSSTSTSAELRVPSTARTDISAGAGDELAGRLVVYAVGDDTQPDNESVSRRLAGLIPLPSEGLDLFVYLGDVRPSGSSQDFARYDAIYGGGGHDLRTKTASVIGNHETDARLEGWIPYWNGSLVKPWPGSFTRTDPSYYALKLQGWKFLMLDTNLSIEEGSEQYAFLLAELKEPGYHCVVCGHSPRWSSGTHGDDDSLDAAWKAMCDYGAVAYVAGHDHNSQIQPRRDRDGDVVESGGCIQIVAGAGGAPLHALSPGPGHTAASWGDGEHFAILRLLLSDSELKAEFIAEDGALLHAEALSL